MKAELVTAGGFWAHIWLRNQTYTVATAPFMTGSVMRRLRLFLGQCAAPRNYIMYRTLKPVQYYLEQISRCTAVRENFH